MKIVTLASLLTCATVFGTVPVGPAAAHPFGGGVMLLPGNDGGWLQRNMDVPCVIWRIAPDHSNTAPCRENPRRLYGGNDAGLGLDRKTTA